MFKKKSNLPPRPKIPTVSQIIVDVSATVHEDPLFETAKNISYKGAEDAHEQDPTYQKIKKFLKINHDLQEGIMNLESLCQSLKDADDEISKLSEDLKEQAVKALL